MEMWVKNRVFHTHHGALWLADKEDAGIRSNQEVFSGFPPVFHRISTDESCSGKLTKWLLKKEKD